MNNSNPLIPQGSLLEQQNRGRRRVKVAVYCVLACHVVFFGGLLMLGCSREKAGQTASQDAGTPPVDTTLPPPPSDNASNPPPTPAPDLAPPPVANNVVTQAPPALPTYTPPVAPVAPVTPPVPAGQEYVVVKGDSYYSIGKKLGVSMKALQDANPTVPATKLKAGQKIQVPAPTSASAAAPAAATESSDTYVVKSGDNLYTIAKTHGVSVKELRAANGLKTDRITVGKKLKLPAKAAIEPAPTPAAAPAPLTAPTSAPGTL